MKQKEDKRGGSRPRSGARKKNDLERKHPITIYVKGEKIEAQGGPALLKAKIEQFVKELAEK